MNLDLVGRALAGIDHARRGFPGLVCELGGGAVLGERYRHRRSLDIDFFLNNVQALPLLSPRLNGALSRGMTDYDEGSSAVEVRYAEGKVDFIVAPDLTRLPSEPMLLGDTTVQAQATAEILAKKILYRAADLPIRDVFDLAVVLAETPDVLTAVQPFAVLRCRELLGRLVALEPRFEARSRLELLLEPGADRFIPRAVVEVHAWVLGLRADG